MAGLAEFKQKYVNDAEFAQKFADATSVEGFVALAKAEGYDFSVEQLCEDTQLTEGQLAQVAGGNGIMERGLFDPWINRKLG